jgi:CRP-like cAMP-binding protein
VKPSTELATEEKTFIYDRIKNLSFFSLLSEDSKQSIISLFRKCTNNDSPYLFKQGWRGKYFFIIAKGKVIVEQNRFVVRRLGEGDCFGELSLMYGLERTTSIRTSKDTLKNNIYYVLKGRDYLEIIK